MLFSESCQNKSLSITELTDFLSGGLPLAAAEPDLTQGFKSKSNIYWFTSWFALSVGGKWENWIALEVTSCADLSLPCICQGSALALRADWGITNIQFTGLATGMFPLLLDPQAVSERIPNNSATQKRQGGTQLPPSGARVSVPIQQMCVRWKCPCLSHSCVLVFKRFSHTRAKRTLL